MDAVDSVARQEESLKSWREGEIRQRADIVVREVNCILILPVRIQLMTCDARTRLQNQVRREIQVLTRATARFSICGILCPFHDINGARSSVVLFFSAFTHL